MDDNREKIYSELRTIRKELMDRLKRVEGNQLIRSLIREELKDVNNTLIKLRSETFGVCEVSGELLPNELLRTVPTLRSKDDVTVINSFYSKPIY